MEPQQGRDPVLIYNGKDLMVLDSAGDPLRLLPSASSADTVLLQGIRGEFYAIKPDVKQVCAACRALIQVASPCVGTLYS